VAGERRNLRRAAALLGALVVVPCVVTLILRQFAVDTRWTVAYVAASPYVLVAGGLAVIMFLLARAWLGAAIAVVVSLVLAVTQLPLYVADAAPPANGVPIVVMTINTRFGLADAAAIVSIARQRDVGLLLLQELTPEAFDALVDAGLEDTLPHVVTAPLDGANGSGVWSRTPLTPLVAPGGFGHPPVVATTVLAGLDVVAASVHPVSPFPSDSAQWSAELDLLTAWLDTGEGPVIVGGDFNATFDHRQFRDLLGAGLHDAVEQAGAGYLPTYPVGRRYPPLISIDHVLTRGPIVATAVDTVELSGTDHLALVATLVVAGAP
jgi:endonuclease/exonuclease/phosphatase (EEP) superfamily protein YafD